MSAVNSRCGTSFGHYRYEINVPSNKVRGRDGQGVYAHVIFPARNNPLIPHNGSGQIEVLPIV